MWIARDKDDTLWLFSNEPELRNNGEFWMLRGTEGHGYAKLDESLFPEVSKHATEPTEVEIEKDEYGDFFIARSKDETPWFFTARKPIRDEENGAWMTCNIFYFHQLIVNENELPEELRSISWEDEEPVCVTIKIKEHVDSKR